mgnify:CR=1 FL=1
MIYCIHNPVRLNYYFIKGGHHYEKAYHLFTFWSFSWFHVARSRISYNNFCHF